MVDNSVWPFGSSMQSLANHFPPNSNIEPADCGRTVSVTGSEPSVEMAAFPSPTNGPLTVTFDLQSERRVQLQLVDASGREAAQWDLGQRTPGSFVETLDMSAQPDGTYLLRAFTDDGVGSTWRVVVAH